jgi:hypothetical protein
VPLQAPGLIERPPDFEQMIAARKLSVPFRNQLGFDGQQSWLRHCLRRNSNVGRLDANSSLKRELLSL